MHKFSFKATVQFVKLSPDRELGLGALDLCYYGNLREILSQWYPIHSESVSDAEKKKRIDVRAEILFGYSV